MRLIWLLFLAVFLSGCSTFNRDWKRLAQAPASQTGIEGRWTGTWKSEETSHTDKLRCIISRKDTNIYLARFHAKYSKVFSFSYTVPLMVRETAGRYEFDGEANLGWFAGGVYQYKGEANATKFISTYKAKSDYGTFRMTRPELETK